MVPQVEAQEELEESWRGEREIGEMGVERVRSGKRVMVRRGRSCGMGV